MRLTLRKADCVELAGLDDVRVVADLRSEHINRRVHAQQEAVDGIGHPKGDDRGRDKGVWIFTLPFKRSATDNEEHTQREETRVPVVAGGNTDGVATGVLRNDRNDGLDARVEARITHAVGEDSRRGQVARAEKRGLRRECGGNRCHGGGLQERSQRFRGEGAERQQLEKRTGELLLHRRRVRSNQRIECVVALAVAAAAVRIRESDDRQREGEKKTHCCGGEKRKGWWPWRNWMNSQSKQATTEQTLSTEQSLKQREWERVGHANAMGGG